MMDATDSANQIVRETVCSAMMEFVANVLKGRICSLINALQSVEMEREMGLSNATMGILILWMGAINVKSSQGFTAFRMRKI